MLEIFRLIPRRMSILRKESVLSTECLLLGRFLGRWDEKKKVEMLAEFFLGLYIELCVPTDFLLIDVTVDFTMLLHATKWMGRKFSR